MRFPALLALLIIAAGSSAHAQSAATCQRTANALKPDQRGQLAAWIKSEADGADLTLDHICPIDANNALIALADFHGLASNVYIGNFADGGLKMRRLRAGAIESPALLRPTAGGLFLVFAAQTSGRGAIERRIILLDLQNGGEKILASGIIANTCAGAGRLLRLYPRVADVNNDRQLDIVIEREIVPCDQEKPVRSQENFLAEGASWRKP